MKKEISYQISNPLLNTIKSSLEELKKNDKNEITVKDDLIYENIKTNLGFPLNDNDGDIIIHLLANNNKVNILEEIINFFKINNLDYNQIVNLKNFDNYSPLHFAASNGDISTVELLCKHNADVNSLTDDKFTPLHLASGNGNIEVVDFLIKYGANPKAITGNGSSVLHYASGATGDSHFDLVKHLIKKYGAIEFINFQDEEKYTPLHEATHSGNLELSKYLIEECGADITLLTKYGNSILHMAAVSGNLNLVKYLIEKHKVNVHAIDNDGHTILHYAVIGNNLDIVKYLIEEYGLDPSASITNGLDKGQNALQLAKNDNIEMINYLKQKMDKK